MMNLFDLKSKNERIELLEVTCEVFSDRAWKYEAEGSFPVDNIKDLKQIGYHTLTVPKEYGGLEISLLELVQLQEVIAKYDGSTALSIGWHMGIIKHLDEKRPWPEEMFTQLCDDVVNNGALINSAASERGTGSPTRGGRPETTAVKRGDDWVINGRKIFTTLSPLLDYFIVTASIALSEEVGNFLIPRSTKGVSIEETWDSIAMRGTGSHDLILEDVTIPSENLVEYVSPGKKPAAGWLLHIPACYLGIAKAAQDYAVHFAKNYSPNSIEGPIAQLPFVKQKIGEMQLFLKQSERFLYSVAKEWDEGDDQSRQYMKPDEGDDQSRQYMKPDLGAVKYAVVDQSMKVVDLAMRVTGARSLSERNPLQRYWRDVRAGLHNPPMDDATIMLLADEIIQKVD